VAKFLECATTLEVKDVVASEAIYREKLGFGVSYVFGAPPTFCILNRGKATIFFGLARKGAAAVISVDPYLGIGSQISRAERCR
jgi:hypothetical protein